MRGWLVAGVLLAFLVAGWTPALATHPPEQDLVERPAFTVGDWWHYRLKGGIHGTVNNTVDRRENVTTNGTTWDVWRIRAEVAAGQVRAPTFTDQFVETKWVRVTDHARVRTHAASDDAEQTNTYAPPQPEIAYPFHQDSHWTHTSNVTREEKRSVFGVGRPDPEGPVKYGPERVSGQVIGKVRLSTVAGVFVTYLIEYNAQSRESERFFRWYYAPEACTNVLEEYYDSETSLEPKVVYELTKFQCTQPAPPLEETPDVQDEPPAPSWLLPNDVPPPEEPKRKDRLPGFDAALVLPALAVAFLLAWRRR